MKWLLKFKRKSAPPEIPAKRELQDLTSGQCPGEGCVCTVVRCAEEDLQGEKESMGMELEKNSGEPWICVDAVRLKSREDRHDD